MEKPTEAGEDPPSPKGVEVNAAPDTAPEDRVSEEEDPQETDARVMEVCRLVDHLFREEAGRGWVSGRERLRELAEEIRGKKLLPPRLCLQRYCSRVTESQSAAFCSGCFQYARPMDGLPLTLPCAHATTDLRENYRVCRAHLTQMETASSSQPSLSQSLLDDSAYCDWSVEKLEKAAEQELLANDGDSKALGELLALAKRGGNEKAHEAVLRVSDKYWSAVVARRNLLGDGKANSRRGSALAARKALENEVDGGLDGGPNGSAGLGDASSELPACRHGVYPCRHVSKDKARLT